MYVGRAAWGGPAAPIGDRMSAPAASVTAHHSLTPALPCGAPVAKEEAAMRQIQAYHRDRNGWQGIGYNFVITQNGNIYEGRGWGRVGAHAGTKAGNATSIGVCFLIDGRTEAPSPAALDAFARLRWTGVDGGHLARGHGLRLHRDWKATDCPGDVAAAVLRGLGAPVEPSPRILERGDTGPDVEALQVGLVRGGFLTPAQMATGPGIYGPATEAAVRKAQRIHGIEVDGIVGSDTRRVLGL